MMDPLLEYERFMQEYAAFLRARSRRHRTVLNPLVLLERLISRGLRTFEQAVSKLVLAIMR